MPQTVYVISDLHLGGEPPSDTSPGFQICGEPGQALLADFLTWVAGQRRPGRDIHLVVNGDSVDFLAEKPFAAFTADDEAAVKKLRTILEVRTPRVWNAFQQVVQSGARVTFTLGNHDLELALPKPRALLLQTLGPGRVDLLFDNSALQIGNVLIEHGNRYDGWNAVLHDSLRRVCSAISRREKPVPFLEPPGSRLAVEVMNGLKQELRFIDLLKPEGAAALPFIVALKPAMIGKIKALWAYRKQANAVRYTAEGVPEDPEMIGARRVALQDERPYEDKADQFGVDPEQIGWGHMALGLLDRWRAETDPGKRAAEIELAYDALQQWLGAHFSAFDTQQEDEMYLRPLRASVRRGFETIVYGHTHLVKRLSPLGAGDIYLNTGTWADLMAVPRGILLDDPVPAKQQLAGFLEDLSKNDLEKWKRQLPAFAKLELDGTTVIDRDVFVYLGQGRFDRVPDGRLVPLGQDEQDG